MSSTTELSRTLQAEYARRFKNLDTYRDRVWSVLCRVFFSRYISSQSVVLDLGAGWGEFSRNCVAEKKYAMDLNPDTAQRVEGHASFVQQDCSQPWPLSSASLDVVFTSNFLEHLPSKQHIEATLTEALRCLKPGGRMICLGPNIKYVPGAYWDFWDHHVPLSETSLAEGLALRGFAVDLVVPRFLPYTMSGGRTPPLSFVSAYLRMPWVWPLFGKQFLVVARKPASRQQ